MGNLRARIGRTVVTTGCCLALSFLVSPLALATGSFTTASLKGSYAYVNSTEGVASFGPMTFDGDGRLELQLVTNVPCATPAPGCQRRLGDFDVTGTYSVNPDGTGVATVEFPTPTGPVTYDFVVVEANRKGPAPLAIKVFAAGRSGGLDGQLIAPTWTRQFEN